MTHFKYTFIFPEVEYLLKNVIWPCFREIFLLIFSLCVCLRF